MLLANGRHGMEVSGVAYKLMLKQIREDKNITQAEMAKSLGMNLSTYRTWEQGVTRITLENAVRCCEALGCTPNDLCNWYEDHPAVPGTWSDPRQAELNRCYEALGDDGRVAVLGNARVTLELEGREGDPPGRADPLPPRQARSA